MTNAQVDAHLRPRNGVTDSPLIPVVLGIWMSLAAAVAVSAQVRNGVSADPAGIEVARPTLMNFDPPCLFAQTLPLQAAPYMNPGTGAFFTRGEGAVVNRCGNFGVSGYSGTNFLAWNCDATSFDGTKPALPAEIKFVAPASEVSIRVASRDGAGEPARLAAYNARFVRIAATSRPLTAVLTRLTVTAPDGAAISYVRLSGPCVMVADDIRVAR